MITKIAHDHVSGLCRAKENLFGPLFFEEHIMVVAYYAKKLAELLGANAEIVELAAYLHDISAISDFKTLSEHPAIGAATAAEFLKLNGYPAAKIEKVKECIVSHSLPRAKGKGALEEVCVSNADAISQIIKPAYWLYYIFSVRKFDFEAGRDWYRARIESHRKAMIPEALSLIQDEYTLARTLF